MRICGVIGCKESYTQTSFTQRQVSRTKNEERQKKEGTIIPSPSPSTITKGEQANINVRPHTATIHPTKKPKLV